MYNTKFLAASLKVGTIDFNKTPDIAYVSKIL